MTCKWLKRYQTGRFLFECSYLRIKKAKRKFMLLIRLPYPSLPDYSLFFWVVEDAIIISIIAFASSMSLSNIFAKKHKYKVHSNKELFALGMANVIGSFFKCFVCSGTFVQSVILESSGGKSKVTLKLLFLVFTI